MYDNFPKAIFFDLDDTITSFDSVCEPAWKICCEEFVQKYHTVFHAIKLKNCLDKYMNWYWSDPVRHKIGRENIKEARREVVRGTLKELGIDKEDMALELADHYSQLQNSMISLLPGSKEALELIKGMGIRMAVITNGASAGQREKLERFGITDYFEQIFIDSEIGFCKPEKEIFQYALYRLELMPEEVWMVGDNLDWDIWGAKQLGIRAVWNDYSKEGLPENLKMEPDLIVSSIFEMANILWSQYQLKDKDAY